MKVRLDTYFSAGGKMFPKNTCFEGVLEELPEWIQKLVDEKHRDITITDDKKSKKASTPKDELKKPPTKTQKTQKTEKPSSDKEKESEKDKPKKLTRRTPRKTGDK